MSEEERILSEDKTFVRKLALRLLQRGEVQDFLYIVKKYNIHQEYFNFPRINFSSKVDSCKVFLRIIDANYCIPDLNIARHFIWNNKITEFQKLLETNAYSTTPRQKLYNIIDDSYWKNNLNHKQSDKEKFVDLITHTTLVEKQ